MVSKREMFVTVSKGDGNSEQGFCIGFERLEGEIQFFAKASEKATEWLGARTIGHELREGGEIVVVRPDEVVKLLRELVGA